MLPTSDGPPCLLLTGGSGLLATNWGLACRDRYRVVLAEHRQKIEIAGIDCVPIALEDSAALRAELLELDPEIVVHTVALTNVDQCEAEPDLAAALNVELARNVAAAVREHGRSRLIHISSDQLFDGSSSMIREVAIPCPINVYGETKLAGERAVFEELPEALVVRTNFFGWGPGTRTSFSDWIIGALRSKTRITMFDDVFFTPILIDHLVRVCHDLLAQDFSGVVHVAGSERVSKHDFAIQLADEFDLDTDNITRGSVESSDIGARRPRDMSLSTELVTSLLDRRMPTVREACSDLLMQERQGRSELLRAAVRFVDPQKRV